MKGALLVVGRGEAAAGPAAALTAAVCVRVGGCGGPAAQRWLANVHQLAADEDGPAGVGHGR